MTDLLTKVWGLIADGGRDQVRLGARGGELARAEALAAALASRQGETPAPAWARELLALYDAFSKEGKLSFLTYLAGHFAPALRPLSEAAAAYLAEPTAEAASVLAGAAESPRRELLCRINMAPGGTAALIGMRALLLDALPRMPALKPLEDDLLSLFGAWFNPGFLDLRRIDWNSPAALLEKLAGYEAVHEIRGWGDMRRRLQKDRRCYAFFHPALPDEPLIFVEIALCRGLAAKIEPLLSEEADAFEPDTAIFYSISNCQKGLRGVSFGNFLIRSVVEVLSAEMPPLKTFATLSPVPGFRRWLERRLKSGASLLQEQERAVFGSDPLSALARLSGDALAPDHALKPALLRLCALYLTIPGDGEGMDKVARFHLKNGARLERIHWAANPGPKGMAESFGLMVNYLYDIANICDNHEKFQREGGIAVSQDVTRLLKSGVLRAAKSPLAHATEPS